ncbi:putative leucine-rich repeat domain superfamily [Helianthus annuus]|nr:putative leucine-rich repeat domain superfamily [Helianthus annuus]
MGGACSRKRDPQSDEENAQRVITRRYSKSGSSKWLGTSFSRASVDNKEGLALCPSLMELCIYKISEEIDQYGTFSTLPRDISQQIFNELVDSQRLTEAYLEAFHDCDLQDINLGEYPGVDDAWMDVICSQGSSLLSADISGSDVTDSGLFSFKDCTNIEALNLNFCEKISDVGLGCISGFSNLTNLSFKRNNNITAKGMSSLSGLVNLSKLDLERCTGIHGGLVHLRGIFMC